MISPLYHLRYLNGIDDDPEFLSDLIRHAQDTFDRMTPEQKEEHRKQQAINFAYGNAAIDNPNVTREMVEDAHVRRKR